jgi:hypothetical protein
MASLTCDALRDRARWLVVLQPQQRPALPTWPPSVVTKQKTESLMRGSPDSRFRPFPARLPTAMPHRFAKLGLAPHDALVGPPSSEPCNPNTSPK